MVRDPPAHDRRRLVALRLRLPGPGGHPAGEGIGLHPATPVELPSILLAALASLPSGSCSAPRRRSWRSALCFGGVAAHFARAEKAHAQDLVLAGAFAAIAVVLRRPDRRRVHDLRDGRVVGPRRCRHKIGHVLLPGFVASGTGYLVFAGLGRWHGLDVARARRTGPPGLRERSRGRCRLVVPLAVVRSSIVVSLATRFALEYARAPPRGDDTLLVGGAAVGLTAVAYRALADRPVELVLFSGQASLPAVIAEGSASVLVAPRGEADRLWAVAGGRIPGRDDLPVADARRDAGRTRLGSPPRLRAHARR